jgi:UDP-N-acetyl-D-glucosamine dehydrogenase
MRMDDAPARSATAAALIEKLTNRRATNGVLGLGYVGMPLALRFAEVGFTVLGFDLDAAKVAAIAAGRSPLHGLADAAVARQAGRLSATGDFARAGECDAILICVPTPLGRHREPDLSFVTGSMASLAPYLRAGQAISLESTTYPGTTEEEIVPVLERAGLVVGETAFALYSPEREDPGNARYGIADIPKIVSGHTPACRAVAEALYAPVAKGIVPVSNTRTAETVKLLENIFRAVNIGLVNELKMLCHRMDIDVFEVIEAAKTKPFGFMPFWPGPGLGGHCIPIDPFYLTWKAKEVGFDTRFIELAGQINSAMPHYVVDRLSRALNDSGRALKGARILLLGLAYKPDVADPRESPTLEIRELLADLGADVAYHDPLLPTYPNTRRFGPRSLSSQPLTAETLAAQDAVMVVTPHRAIDFDLVLRHARLIIDTRGVYRAPHPNVVPA